MRFLDSNIIVRYLTLDDANASSLAAQIINNVSDGKEEVFTTDVHIHEIVYVLASKNLYGLNHKDIRDRLKPLLLMKKLKLSNKQMCLKALDLFVEYPHLDFADALAIAGMHYKGVTEIISFDHDFDKVKYIRRVEA